MAKNIVQSVEETMSNITRPTPTLHGTKLSSKMTSVAKNEFLLKWQAYREKKLKSEQALSIGQKQTSVFDKPKKNLQLPSTKFDTMETSNKNREKKIQTLPKERESVFDRLYTNVKVPKKCEKSINSSVDCISKPDKSVISHSKIFSMNKNEEIENHKNQCEMKNLYSPVLIENLKDFMQDTEKQPENNDPIKKNSEEPSSFSVFNDKRQFHSLCRIEKEKIEFPGKSKNESKPLIRRSISMLYRKKQAVLRTMSEKNLHELKALSRKENILKPVALTCKAKPSVKMLPSTLMSSTKIKKKNKTSLKDNLEEWLRMKGHELDGYRHLRCFGIEKESLKLNGSEHKKEANKSASSDSDKGDEVKEVSSPQDSEVEDKKDVSSPLNTPDTVDLKPDLSECENWLRELFRLIVEVKYPIDRCEEWLSAIRNKCPACTQSPIYWECLTALNGDEMNVTSKKEVEKTDNLTEIFDKIAIENQKVTNSGIRLEKGIDPDNIFKSTIVKFAVNPPKSIKECGAKNGLETGQFVATPVRRSSRIKTPAKGTVNSLRALTPDVSSKVTFKANTSLLNRF